MSSSAGIVWLNTAETARRLGVTPRTLYRFIDEGQLPAYRFGRVIRLKESEVEDFIVMFMDAMLDNQQGLPPVPDVAG